MKSSKGEASSALVDKTKRNPISVFIQEVRNHWVLFLMIIPAIVYFIIFCYVPMPGAYIAFVDYNAKKGIFGSTFVGMQNFMYLIKTGQLWLITKNTVLYNLAFLALGNILQIIFAIMLSEIGSKIFKRVSQSFMLFPYFISYVIVGVFAYNFFNYDNGFINGMLTSWGQEPYSFYTEPGIWKYIIVMFKLWHDTGYGVIIYLAAITGIDSGIYEAAVIDGASTLQRITRITMPLLKPTFVLMFIFGLGGILRGSFDLFYNLVRSNSLLFEQTDIIETFVFRSLAGGNGQFNFSQGAAAGLYQAVFGLVLVMTVNAVIKKVDPENSLF